MGKTFCERFDDVASRRPGSTAIEFDGQIRWSYRKLQRRSRAIALAIKRAGITKQSVVAIALPKSPQYVASLLGIWRAGCAALPIANELPRHQQERIIQRAHAAAVMTVTERLLNCPAIDPDQYVESDIDCSPAEENDLAYVIFTSGSTGQPKAVAVQHRGLMPMLDAQIGAFEIDASTRSLFYLSTAFDASMSDIGTALIGGGTLVIDTDLGSLSVEELMTRIDRRKITYADLPPALMSCAAQRRLNAPDSLQTVVVGGEVCPGETQRWWASKVRLVNVYGPTEATVCTSLNVCDPVRNDATSIGQPIASMRYRIEPFASSRPSDGELWISGPGIARGYLDDEQLTREKFVIHVERRWYRTGDRVQMTDDGQFLFRGRIDRQFKLLGKLVEPAEIEQCLVDQPEIAEAVVVPIHGLRGADRNETPRATSIAAVLRPAPGCDVDLQQIGESLAHRLPDWMIPHHFSIVDRIPRTHWGKPDRLTISNMFAPGKTARSKPPSHPYALKLRFIFQKSLRLNEINWDDDFFLVGGDSLAALQVLAHAETDGIQLTLEQLRRGRTLRNCLDAMHSRDAVVDAMGAAALNRQASQLIDALPKNQTSRATQSAGKQILLTGATGLLGTWVLEGLLSRSATNVVCLVRACDPQHGLNRLNASRRSLLGNDARKLDRRDITVVCGDVSRDHWGLRQSEWEYLSRAITDIMHLAADVHLMKSFVELRRTNLDAVAWAIRLASLGAVKSLHYASTLSVFVGSDLADDRFLETDELSRDAMVFGGYAQTKWAAERLLRSCNREFPLGVYRIGLLTGNSIDGVGASSDQLALFTRGLAHIGMVPVGSERLRFDVTTVDAAANAFCELAANNATGTFHVCGKRTVRLTEWVAAMRSVGMEIAEVSLEEFQRAVRDAMAGDSGAVASSALMSLCRRLSRDERGNHHRQLDLFLATDATFDTTHSDVRLRLAQASQTEVDGELLIKLVGAILLSHADAP